MRSMTMVCALAAGAGLAACGSGGGGGPVPAPPSALQVSEMDGAAHVVWRDNADNETGFLIERADGDGLFGEIGSQPFDTTVYHDATVAPGIAYRYRIAAENIYGVSEYTSEVIFSLPAGAGGGHESGGH